MTGLLGPHVTEEQAVHRRLMQFGEHESLATPMWEARDTSVRTIAAYLASLWEPPARLEADGQPIVTEKGLPHARASVLNLIVTVNDDAAADRIVRTLLDLGVRHPSRAIVLVPQHGSDSQPLDARISTHCHETAGDDGERMCYEEVILTVRGEAADHLSGIVAPLLIHDLPTHVWWPGDPPFNDPVFDQLVEMGDRVLFDTSDFVDLLGGLRRLGSLRHASGVGDLAWERLAWWQELTAQFFDAPRFRRYLPNLSRLLISYAVPQRDAGVLPGDPNDSAPGVTSPMAQALLYAGWIATRLGWRRYRTVQTLQDGGFRLTLEGTARDDRARDSPRADERRAGGRAYERPTPVARRDGRRRVHHRPHRRRRGRRHERGRHDRQPAPSGHGDAARGRAAERPAHRRRRQPRLRERTSCGRDHPRLGARDGRVIDLDVRGSADAVAREAANRFIAIVADAIERQGIARVALSGGSTPKQVCPLLLEPARRDAVDWSAVEFFWGDERAVPPDHPESNFGVAYFMLISQLPNVRPDRVHRMQAEAPDLEAAALAYETELRLAFGVRGDVPPAFDLIWLGMGMDGHTASLFPGSPALDESERWVVPSRTPLGERRMTLTFPVLNAARETIFVVTGADKADALAHIRSGDTDLPAARVTGPAVHWIVDAAAAARVA